MVAEITSRFEAALAAGAPVIRLLGNVGWGRVTGPRDAELASFEARLTPLARKYPSVILCLHEVRSLTGPTARYGLLRTHPQMLDEGGVLGNPFFVPFARFRGRLEAVTTELSKEQEEREASRRQAEILQAVFDNIPVMISFVDASGRLLLVNREWERVLGWSFQEAQGYDFLNEAYPDPESRREVLEFMRKSEQRWQDFRTRTKDGRIIDTSWLRVALSDGMRIGFGLDLTERKRLEKGVRTGEALLSEGERLAQTGSWVLNLESGRLVWSAGAFRIFRLASDSKASSRDSAADGLRPASYAEAASMVHPEDRMNMVYPEDRTRVRTTFEQAVAEKKGFEIDHRLVHPDGSVRQVHVVGHPTFGDSGDLLEYVGVIIDVTERQQAEEALRKSERVLREAQELGHTGSWEQDLVTGKIFNTDENLRLFFGDEPSKGARLEDYVDAVHPDDRAMVKERREQLLAEGDPRDIEFRVVWPDGSVHVLFGRATVVREESGRVVRIFGTNVDITERKRAEASVRESQQLLNLVLATLPVGVSVTDRTGDIVLVNAASKRIWGGDPIVSGRRRWVQSQAFWHDSGERVDPANWASVRALTEGQTSLNEVIDIETFDGRRKTIQNSAAPIRDADGTIVGAVFVNEDVTEQVLAQESLQRSHDELRLLSEKLRTVREEERKRIAREVHDEVGQALTALQMDVAWLEKKLETSPETAPESCASKLEAMSALLDTTLGSVQRIATELRPGVLDELGLEAATEWYVRDFESRTGIPCDMRSDLKGASVEPDLGTAVFRILQEALTNVARHSAADRVEIRLSAIDEELRLEVRDNGRGIPRDQLAASQSLGLLGMRERARSLGGNLLVRGTPDVGTTVTLRVPL